MKTQITAPLLIRQPLIVIALLSLLLASPAAAQVASEESFIDAIVVDGVPDRRAVAQLWNPVGSGRLVVLDSLDIAHSSSLETGCDMRVDQTALSSLLRNAANKHLGKDDSLAELRQENVVPASIPGRIVYECWISGSFNDHHYEFSPPLIISEGYGFGIAASRDGVYLIVSFQFRERAP